MTTQLEIGQEEAVDENQLVTEAAEATEEKQQEEATEVEETQTEESQESEEPEEKPDTGIPPEVQKQLDELQAQIKASNDKGRRADRENQALRGQIKRLSQDRESVEDIKKMIAVMLKATNAEPETIAQFEKIQNEGTKRQQESSYQARYDSIVEDLMDAVKDEETGEAVLDLQNSPELEDVRQEWNRHNKDNDLVGLAQVVAKAARVTARVQKDKSRNEQKAQRQQATQKRSEKLDMDSGNNAPAKMSDEQIWEAYGRGQFDDHARAMKAGRKLGYIN